ncbi:hypothetical protein ENSA5_39970 [Enhygromyxa salina]|uniref:Alginate export domain-containing protein n=1 Tax=Enhygromyxa salina TaxID=215803 RepID=A0A2S9XRC7_9BACT|nr:hypothetical protein [Enhygromyxa salina]PRP95406.1 hypothetical protein ENSA5_39970 [Enhygromyxa salina]
MLGSILSLTLALGPGLGAPEDGKRFSPPPIEHGFDLRESWDDIWRRFEDRNGRPDPHGPLLQPAPELQTHEYELTQAVAAHPLYLERDWNLRTRGARVFIHSDDEFSFFNQVRLKEQMPMGSVGALGIRYDRIELREIRSSLVQLAFAFPDIRGTGAFVEIRPIARFEKPDLDIEFAAGWARPHIGQIQARVFLFDPFNNASDALAQNRAVVQDLRVVQRSPSIGVSGESEVFLLPSLRAQAFFGAVLPARASLYYADEDSADVVRTQWSVLGGGWLEWALPVAPLWLGASTTVVTTLQDDHDEFGELVDRLPERESRARVYMLAHLDKDSVGRFVGRLELELAGSFRLTELWKHASQYGSIPRDRSWLGMVRALWMPTKPFGIELGYLVLDRYAPGDNDLATFLTATNHRLSTRFSLAFDPHVRITFGVGWDLDDPDNPYDQGGMSLTARW